MAKKGDIYLGILGSEVLLSPGGRKHPTGINEISRSDHTADGTYVKDIIKKKMKIMLNYDVITGTGLLAILDLYDLDSELSYLEYITDTTTMVNRYGDPITVIMSPFGWEEIALRDDGLYEGVSIQLDEV